MKVTVYMVDKLNCTNWWSIRPTTTTWRKAGRTLPKNQTSSTQSYTRKSRDSFMTWLRRCDPTNSKKTHCITPSAPVKRINLVRRVHSITSIRRHQRGRWGTSTCSAFVTSLKITTWWIRSRIPTLTQMTAGCTIGTRRMRTSERATIISSQISQWSTQANYLRHCN